MSDANHPPSRSGPQSPDDRTEVKPRRERRREALFGEDPGECTTRTSVPEAEDNTHEQIVIIEDGAEVGFVRSDGSVQYSGTISESQRFLNRIEDGKERMYVEGEDGVSRPHQARGEELLSRVEERLECMYVPYRRESF